MQVKGIISWFGPEEWIKNKEGEQVYSSYDGEPLKKRRVGIIAQIEREDGSIGQESMVAETQRDFSDDDLQNWKDNGILKLINLHFEDCVNKNNDHHFMVCSLLSVKSVPMES